MWAKFDQNERIVPIDLGRSKSSAKVSSSLGVQPVAGDSAPSAPYARTTGVGRKSTRCAATPTGPAPAPPPPCGIENVLCRLRCMRSKPMSPGRVLPISAFAFAPS